MNNAELFGPMAVITGSIGCHEAAPLGLTKVRPKYGVLHHNQTVLLFGGHRTSGSNSAPVRLRARTALARTRASGSVSKMSP